MPQETNLNVSPYFDDFDEDKNYYKVLFKPGYPIQSRELTTLQSILQNQIESQGRHLFKEGSVVIPGNIRIDSPLPSVTIEDTYQGTPVSLYFDQLLGKKLRGSVSGVTGEVVYTLDASNSDKNLFTLYVKYVTSGGVEFENKTFVDGETLILESDLTYGNLGFTVQSGQGICNTTSINSNSQGSSAIVTDGIYFVRGYFLNVSEQRILLDQYGSAPSYRIGFDVVESIVNANQDNSLFDNARGYSNYTAPGADRLKIDLILSKKELSSTDVDNFVEVLTIKNGVVIFKTETTQYSLIRDELARRTFDESGNYFVNPFNITIRDCLNDRTRTSGIYYDNQLTSTGETPSEDKLIYQIGPGKAYVKGYDVEKISSSEIVVDKPRTTRSIENEVISYNAGTSLVLNRVYGAPTVGLGTTSFVNLMDSRIGVTSTTSSGNVIGVARVYDFIPQTDYVDNTSKINIRLFDIQTYTTIGLTTSITSLSTPALIKGKRSKASGYLKTSITNSNSLTLYNVSGTFLENEQITINGIDNGRLINQVTDYNISDVKSIYSSVGLSTFNADVVLSQKTLIAPQGTSFDISARSSGISTVYSGLDFTFTNKIKAGDIVSYANTSLGGTIVYNKVESVASNGLSFTISGITTVTSICDGSLPSSAIKVTNIGKVFGVANSNNSSLMTKMRFDNISNINLENQEILQRRTFNNQSFSGGFIRLTITESDLYFASFDEDRFVITYSDGSIEPMREDKYDKDTTGKILTFYGLTRSSGTANVITTIKNVKPSHKLKTLNKTSTLVVDKSKLTSSGIGTTSLNDGLTYSNVYGVRVQDNEICLNVPDVVRVLAVYESTDTSDPQLPKIRVSSNQNFIIGEQIIGSSSGSVALVVNKVDIEYIEYVYLNSTQFSVGESVIGKESKVTTSIVSKSITSSKDITQNFYLDDGQRPTIYDYARIIRREGAIEPKRKLKVVFQNYVISSGDTGEFVTVNSYPNDGFKHDVPLYGNYRSSDYIDIRPRVSNFTLSASSKSPFEFDSRKFDGQGQYAKYTLCPGENIIVSYSYYLPRRDLIYLTPSGNFEVSKGTPNEIPVLPLPPSNALDIAEITLPPYLYNTNSVNVKISQHKRYRMEDISLIEDRVSRLEKYTTLSMLESNVENYSIKDAETGLDRFKCGFFVDNFDSHNYHDLENPLFRCTTDTSSNTLRPPHYTTSVELQLGSDSVDKNFPLNIGTNVVKTGDLLTLSYRETNYMSLLNSSRTEPITPYLTSYWNGTVELKPSTETWVEEKQSISYVQDIPGLTGLPVPSNNPEDTTVSTLPVRLQTGIESFDWISNAIDAFQDTLWLGKETWEIKNKRKNPTTELKKSAWKKGWGSRYNRGVVELSSQDLVDRKLSNGIVNGNTIRLEWSRKIGDNKKRDAYFDFVRQVLPKDVADDFINRITNNPKNNKDIIVAEYTPSISTTDPNPTPNPLTPNPPTPPIPDGDGSSDLTKTTYIRSRNVHFDAKNLKPRTKFNAFLQNVDLSKYIIPKLLEVKMVSGSFKVGESVTSDVLFTGARIKFRLCTPNHREGVYNAPSNVFRFVPYTQTPFESNYSGSSTILNVDTRSLELQTEEFSGFISKGMTIIGEESKAIATISDIRLISDNSGRLIGSFYIPDPTKPENPRWFNGKNTFRLIDTDSSAETQFESVGTIIIDPDRPKPPIPISDPAPDPQPNPNPDPQPVEPEQRCNAPSSIVVHPANSTAEQISCGWFFYANGDEERSPYEDNRHLMIKWNGQLILDTRPSPGGSDGDDAPNYDIDDINPTGEIRSEFPLEYVRYGTNDDVAVTSGSLVGTRAPIGVRVGDYTYFPVLGTGKYFTLPSNQVPSGRDQPLNAFDVIRIKNTDIPVTPPTRNEEKRKQERKDPLAQSFPVLDETGVFVTSVEVFFETKAEDSPVILQLRPMIAGVPSELVLPYSEVVLDPESVNVSAEGTVATKFTFQSPVYLPGPTKQVKTFNDSGKDQSSEYAIVLLSESPNYRVFISRLGEPDISTGTIISTQSKELGSLFKSQNGSTWTPSQLEDLKYNLYRASFANEGVARFYNTKLSEFNNQLTVTSANNFIPLSKTVVVGLGSTGYDPSQIVPGVTITQNSTSGKLIGVGGSISVGSTALVVNSGIGYSVGTYSNISLVTETGFGSGAVATIGITSVGISTITFTSGGLGYQIGDIINIPSIQNLGFGGKASITSIASTNTFIIDEVQGTFVSGITTLKYTNSSGISSDVGVGVTISTIIEDKFNDGLHMKVLHVNHGMHSPENYVRIKDFRPTSNEVNSYLTEALIPSDTSIAVQSGIGFTTFEGVAVSASNPGYVIIGNEIIGYTSVSGNRLISSSVLRGIDGTSVINQSYPINSIVFKYEFNGISLRRINKVHNFAETDVDNHPIHLNSYYIKIDTDSTDFDGVGIGSNRTNDLYFRKTIQSGRPGTILTNNIQYEILSPNFNYVTPSETEITSRVRTFTGTSISGNEKSFVDAGYQDLPLNGRLYFQSPRLICSDINESKFITESPENKSFGIDVLMSTNDEKVSPMIDIDPTPTLILTSNLLNNPIGLNTVSLYSTNEGVRGTLNDPHSAVYVSKPINLSIPANSLKVILSANKNDTNDIRVLYQIHRVDQVFSEESYELFPGYSNYKLNGVGRSIVDTSLSDGSADFFVNESNDGEFKEYTYTADNLPDFTAFSIKIVMAGTNQAVPPLVSQLRAIATALPKI